jgi:RNA polymerase sigma factor (sigma-70 family)
MNQSLESDVLLARGGDEAAFHRLVETSANTVCSIALAITRNVAASEDIAQESFLAAWAGLKKLRNPASFLPWLRQLTRNQAHLWRRSHEREIPDSLSLSAVLDSRPTAHDTLLADEEQRVLGEVLDALPDDAREVLVLYYREESSTKQVAALLGISDAAVRQRLSRSRAMIREEMLARFGNTVRRTAPGAAFATAVAGALTLAAPSASAALATSAAGKAATAGIAKASLVGVIFGWIGVMMGMKYLEPYYDEQEEKELRGFRNGVLAAITVGCPIIALSAKSWLLMLFAIQAMYGVIFFLYIFRLPRILDRRMKWEQSTNPEAAKQSRRKWMWQTMGQAVAAAIGGAVIMATILRAMN